MKGSGNVGGGVGAPAAATASAGGGAAKVKAKMTPEQRAHNALRAVLRVRAGREKGGERAGRDYCLYTCLRPRPRGRDS